MTSGFILEEISGGGEAFDMSSIYRPFKHYAEDTVICSVFLQETLWLFRTNNPLSGHVEPFLYSDCYLWSPGLSE